MSTTAADARLVAHRDAEVAQVVAGEPVDPGDHDAVDRRAGEVRGPAAGQLALQRLDLVPQRLAARPAACRCPRAARPAGTPTSSAAAASSASSRRSRSIGPVPVTASMRRRFEPIDPSDTIFIGPMSPVRRTWVPPHSSVEWGPASSTRTMSPYFSPKNAMAPRLGRLGLGGLEVADRVVGEHVVG